MRHVVTHALAGTAAPLRVELELEGGVVLPHGTLALDALLASAVAAREALPPIEDEPCEIEIPLLREPAGRFHLATVAVPVVERRETRWLNRRFPTERALVKADRRLTSIRETGGPSRSYRIPGTVLHADRLVFEAWGDEAAVFDLLDRWVTHAGRKRSVGAGRVRRTAVTRLREEDLRPGWPVVAEGSARRNLPLDWAGLMLGHAQGFERLTYPYWQAEGRDWVAVREAHS